MLFLVAVILAFPSMAFFDVMVSLFPDLETFTLLSELVKEYSERALFLSVNIRLYFPSL